MATFIQKSCRLGSFISRRSLPSLLKTLYLSGLIFFITSMIPPPVFSAQRVGIVHSSTSANNFYDQFAYSQLFMAMQHQAMMAGIPFDVLSESDITNAQNLLSYSALIIPSMRQAANQTAIANALQTASNNGVGLLGSGLLLNNINLTKSIFGVVNNSGGYGKAATITAADTSHPAMQDYLPNETILTYPADQFWFDSYQPVAGQNASILAEINVGSVIHNGAIATITGGRNVHFASEEVMADSKLVWSALQWVVYGEQTRVGLKLGRSKSIFVARNDMDSSMYIDDVAIVNIPLLDLLVEWKQNYNFVGSYYINIGNRPNHDEYTDWGVSAPLYQGYLSLGNEIGSHSWTHPDNTSNLNASQLEFEFNQSSIEIGNQLNINVLGAAVPGNAENLAVDWQLNNYLGYLSGRSGVKGSGYPSAFGYLTPDYSMTYFSLNLSPDYTLVEYLGNSSTVAAQIWESEYTAKSVY